MRYKKDENEEISESYTNESYVLPLRPFDDFWSWLS